MSTFAEIKTNIKANLGDSDFYPDIDIDDSVQDAYDEIVAISQCIVKKVTLAFISNLNYYNFRDLANFPAIYVADLMTVTAIFSNLTNQWLLDDKTLKDFDLIRSDWENWQGAPLWWAPTNDYRRYAIAPKLNPITSTFDLYYLAKAPIVVNAEAPLIPSDFQNLIELYSCADLLESAEEFVKAGNYWADFWGIRNGIQNYDSGIFALASRTKNIAKSNLLMIA